MKRPYDGRRFAIETEVFQRHRDEQQHDERRTLKQRDKRHSADLVTFGHLPKAFANGCHGASDGAVLLDE